MLSNRENAILNYLRNDKLPSQIELSKEFEVSINTIRNDFKSLEEKGLAITVRGGVLPAYYPELFKRMSENIEIKEKIAQKAAEFILDHDTISIACGTTCACIGRYLYGKIGVQLVTHSTLFLPYVRTNPNLSLHLLGGEFLPQEDAIVGLTTIEELDRFYPRMAIVGSDNFSFESGITTRSPRVAEVLRKMLSQAQTKILVVESQKYGEARFVKITSLNDFDIIISDTGLSEEIIELFKNNNKEVILVQK